MLPIYVSLDEKINEPNLKLDLNGFIMSVDFGRKDDNDQWMNKNDCVHL